MQGMHTSLSNSIINHICAILTLHNSKRALIIFKGYLVPISLKVERYRLLVEFKNANFLILMDHAQSLDLYHFLALMSTLAMFRNSVLCVFTI